jgi:hypothetical protein
LAQREAADEIIVVDDGSTDGTRDALAALDETIRVLSLPTNGGVGRARNLGIRAARNPWIALLDSDDRWLPDHLGRLADAIAAQPECQIVQTLERWYRDGRRVNPRWRHRPRAGDIFEPSLELCLVSSSAVAFRRALFEDAGRYDERLPVCEDYDLWLRMALRSAFHLVEVETVVKDGGRSDQLSRRYWGMDRFRVFALAKLACSDSLTAARLDVTCSVARRKLDILEAGASKRGKAEAVDGYRRWRRLFDAVAEAGHTPSPSVEDDGGAGLVRWMDRTGWPSLTAPPRDPILGALLGWPAPVKRQLDGRGEERFPSASPRTAEVPP